MPPRKAPPKPPLNWLGNLVSLVIVAAFIVCLTVAVCGGPSVPLEIYALLGIVCGAVFGASTFKRK